MLKHYENDSATGEWLRDHIAMEAEGETVRLPVLCPEAFDLAGMSDAEALKILADEFKDAA